MGEHKIQEGSDRAQFVASLMKDLEALEVMLNNGSFENAPLHIGAEQELCLIDHDLRPAMKNMELLEALNDPCLTTELAKFNLELNLPPLPCGGNSLGAMENDLISRLTEVNRMAHKFDSKIILTGILPTISVSHMVPETMTPNPRYKLLNDVMYGNKGASFEMHIRGIDELNIHSDTVLYESCNTSFQVHLQIDANKVVEELNWAHAISGPILAACTNSPMFFGKRLWRETRIALFHQSTDIRKNQGPYREERPRVDLGAEWLKGGAIEVYRDIVTRHRSLLTPHIDEDPFEVILKGEVPKLKALSMHNGTVYKWNRLCYGVTDNKPHLRVECRYLPSGPTIIDEVANSALWLGCMLGRPKELDRIDQLMEYDDATLNFFRSAREGMQAAIKWINGKEIPSRTLLLEELIPMARTGLAKAGYDARDIDRYLNVIEERVDTGRTGSQWILDTHAGLKKEVSEDQALLAITEGIYQRQKVGKPVHKWDLATIKESEGWKTGAKYVEQIMSKDLITVQEDEPIELVKNIMLWSNIHHIPVEDSSGDMVGLVSADKLLELMFKSDHSITVRDAMDREPYSVPPGTLTNDAFKLMKETECNYLPIVFKNKVLGIITDNDRIKMAENAFSSSIDQKD